MELISRKEAKALGLSRYFTGKPCSRGHLDERRLANNTCISCQRIRDKIVSKAFRSENPDLAKEKDKNRYYKDVEKSRKKNRDQRLKHLEARKIYDNERYKNPTRNERQKLQAKGWVENNRGKRREIIKRHKIKRKQAIPSWLTDEMKNEIKQIYDLAAELGNCYQVDHIHPINGKLQCGLHVPWNLQILPASENLKKRNSHVTC